MMQRWPVVCDRDILHVGWLEGGHQQFDLLCEGLEFNGARSSSSFLEWWKVLRSSKACVVECEGSCLTRAICRGELCCGRPNQSCRLRGLGKSQRFASPPSQPIQKDVQSGSESLGPKPCLWAVEPFGTKDAREIRQGKK